MSVVKLETGEVTNFCIQGAPSLDMATLSNNLVDPIWFPDSSQLLIISNNSQNQTAWRVVLVDLARGYAAQLGEDVKPVGWMLSILK